MTELVELRQYTLHPGRGDELISLFDAHFVESQAEAGMRVYGQFRDLDDPDRFVWIRGFPDASRRAGSLAAFYGRHPAWREHRAAANATMVDSDDVLLLTPVTGDLGAARAAPPPGLFEVVVHYADDPVASFQTSSRPNDYPRLPVRTGEHTVVRLPRFTGRAHREQVRDQLAWPALQKRSSRPPDRRLLEPTPRSWLR